MKASAIGIVSAAILAVVAGAGLGIAHAEATCTEKPAAAVEGQEMLRVAFLSDYHVAGPIADGEQPEGSKADSSHKLQKPAATLENHSVDEEDGMTNSHVITGPISAGKLPEGSDAISSHDVQVIDRDGATFDVSRGYEYGPD